MCPDHKTTHLPFVGYVLCLLNASSLTILICKFVKMVHEEFCRCCLPAHSLSSAANVSRTVPVGAGQG